MQDLTKIDIHRASRRVISHLVIDKRVRWFARVGRRWVPMTAVYRLATGLESCHTYRAQGALETLGVRVRRFGPKTSRRLQVDLLF